MERKLTVDISLFFINGKNVMAVDGLPNSPILINLDDYDYENICSALDIRVLKSDGTGYWKSDGDPTPF